MSIWLRPSLPKNGWRSSKLFIYFVVNLAVFTDAYLYGLIIPVLPFALIEVANVSEADVQWWIGALLAAYGVGLLVGARKNHQSPRCAPLTDTAPAIVGHYADRSGSRKAPYLLGLISLAISTIAISLGRTTWVLFAGRLIQGASSASVHAVGIAILADTVGDDGMGLAMGFVTTMMALGAVLGPMVGGFLYHSFGYFAVFLSAYVLVGVDFIFRFLMVEQDSGSEQAAVKTDAQGYGTFPEESASEDSRLVDAPGEPQSGAGSVLPPSLPSTPPALAVCKNEPLRKQESFRHPILELLGTPRMLAAILGDFMQSFILTGLETILPLRIKTVFHYNSQDVAIMFLVLAVPYAAGPLTGKIADAYGPKTVVSSGYAALAPLVILLRLVDHYEVGQAALLCVLLLAIGTALNMVLTPVWSDTMYLVDEKSKKQPGIFGEKGAYAQAFGLMNMAYAIGSVLGPLLGGWLMERVGFNSITLCAGILCGICVIPCVMYTGGKLPKKTLSSAERCIDDHT